MVLEPFFLFTWLLILLGQFLASHGFPLLGWLLSGLMVFLNIKMVFWPAFRNWGTVSDVEALTFKYYQNRKLHRTYEHPVIQAFAKPKIDWIVSKLPLEGRSILDVGGGNGYFSQYLMKVCPKTHVIDIADEQLKMNPLPASQQHCGTVYELPFKDGEFDVVFASNLLHHLNKPELAMKEITRVAKTHVVIVEASNANPMMKLGALVAAHEFRSRFHSKEVVQKLITDAGLRVTHHTYQGGMVLPNRTPTWTLPFAMVKSFNPWLSYFQIFIATKPQNE